MDTKDILNKLTFNNKPKFDKFTYMELVHIMNDVSNEIITQDTVNLLRSCADNAPSPQENGYWLSLADFAEEYKGKSVMQFRDNILWAKFSPDEPNIKIQRVKRVENLLGELIALRIAKSRVNHLRGSK